VKYAEHEQLLIQVFFYFTINIRLSTGHSEESEDEDDDSFDEEDFGRPDDEDLIDDHVATASAVGRSKAQQRGAARRHMVDPPDYSGQGTFPQIFTLQMPLPRLPWKTRIWRSFH
jgi:hypothetical protein